MGFCDREQFDFARGAADVALAARLLALSREG
jgi:hypothetical protein